MNNPAMFVPHVGWLQHPPGDEVARFVNQGWFEYRESAFLWLYLRPGDVFVDCGAHVGLFTLQAAQVIGKTGRIVALEPNPDLLPILRANVETHGANATLVGAAVCDRSGRIEFHTASAGRAAYSSILVKTDDSVTVTVEALTLADLLEQQGIDRVDLLKLDVEGAEIEALNGARQVIDAGRIPVMLIEFSERNLRERQKRTADLRAACEELGFAFYRLNDESLRLEPFEFTGPVEYENLIAVRGAVGPVEERLALADATQVRKATERIRRGQDAQLLRERALTAETGIAAAARREAALAKEGRVLSRQVRMLQRGVRERDKGIAELERLKKVLEQSIEKRKLATDRLVNNLKSRAASQVEKLKSRVQSQMELLRQKGVEARQLRQELAAERTALQDARRIVTRQNMILDSGWRAILSMRAMRHVLRRRFGR